MVTKKAYRHLSEAGKLFADKKYDQALAEMERMKRRKYLNDHERALMWQLFAGIQAAQGEYEKAAASLEKALELDALPQGAMLDTQFNLGELYLVVGQFDKSAKLLSKWIEQVEKPQPKSYYIVATAYAQAGRFTEALPFAEKAVQGMKQERKAWLQLLLSLHYELKQDHQLEALLKRMIKSFPQEKSYWLQLSALYGEMDRTDESLAVLELAYAQGMLTEEAELINLAKLYLTQGVALKAVRLMEKEMEAGRVGKNPQSLEVYTNALLLIREYDKALTVLSQAAEQSSDGDLYLQLARIHLDRQQWTEARAGIEKALEKGGLDSPGTAYLLLGIVNYNSKRNNAALIAFNKAETYEATRESARRWIDLVQGREDPCSAAGQEGCPQAQQR